jgi:hypothetical protein
MAAEQVIGAADSGIMIMRFVLGTDEYYNYIENN